ncbi:MAG: DNA-binding protein [Proteobacteria bacterium]|nr:DNA-binding protein [Pseudomonadota bacterium]MBU1451251.1 DNA-binding protein [Pseudomonadota bacterium]MBU2470283.1 DNA-binding protein [Pseudomonadota bacterium]MBU2517190.1 DNA-binding protein [Pseudomonadota bacterium]
MLREVTASRRLMGRLPQGADLLEALNELCARENITAGEVKAIGALTKAALGFYNQNSREYEYVTLDQHLEIVSLLGDVSLKDGQPFVHAHVALGDGQGRLWGGHLAPGSEVFACEVMLTVYETPEPFERGFDQGTGLLLWPMQ